MVDINDTASWRICKPVNGTLNKLKGLPTKDLQMFQMLHCPKMERRPDRIQDLYVQLLFFMNLNVLVHFSVQTGRGWMPFLLSTIKLFNISLHLVKKSFLWLFSHLPFILFFCLLSVAHAFSVADFPWCTLQILTLQDKNGLNRFVQLSAFSIALTCSFPIEAVG